MFFSVHPLYLCVSVPLTQWVVRIKKPMVTREQWFDRAYGCLIGQAVGDALGAPAEGSTPQAIRGRWAGGIRGFVSDDPAGTDDTEYAMLTARIILKYGRGLTRENMTEEW